MATEEEVESARRDAELKRVNRRSNIEGFNDWFEYIGGRVVGLSSFIYGGIEVLNPDLIPLNTPHAEIITGVGAVLILGKKVIKIVKLVIEAAEKGNS